jgi:hypothetical protein
VRDDLRQAFPAALPGLALCGLALTWALWKRRRLGEPVSARFATAPVMTLGGARWPWFGALALTIGAGSLFPIAALLDGLLARVFVGGSWRLRVQLGPIELQIAHDGAMAPGDRVGLKRRGR